MKTSKSLLTLTAVVLGCFVVQQVESRHQSPEAAAVANFGFGLKTAGTYLGQFIVPDLADLDPDSDYLTLPILNTFHADGTFVATPGDMFGAGNAALNGLRSPLHGTWTRSGPSKIQWKCMVFLFDESGAFGAPVYGGGVIMRVTGETRWDKTYQNMEGESLIEVLMPGQDPLSDEAPIQVPSTFTMRRVNAE